MSKQVQVVLNTLNGMKPFNTAALKTPFETACEIVTYCLLGVAGFLFFGAFCFAIWTRFDYQSAGAWRFTALLFLTLSQLFVIISLVVYLAPSLGPTILFRKYAFKRLLAELDHDTRHARILSGFGRHVLERTDQYLAKVIERRKLYMSAFIGSPEVAAAFSLVAAAWSVCEKVIPLAHTAFGNALFAGIAFLGGIAAGAILLNAVLRRYSYYRDLLALARQNKVEDVLLQD